MAGLIIELILVFIAFCAALWFGAPWPYVVFPVYLGMLSLKFTPVGKRLKVSWVFLASMALGLLTALGVGQWFFGELTQLGATNPDNQLLKFFIGPLALRLFWSAVFGFVVAFDLLALFLIPLAYFSAQGKYGDYEVYRKHKLQATKTSLFGILGVSQGRINVREGKAQMESKPEDSLLRFGGPGELMVQEGNAVILEQNGRVSRVVASGPTFLRSFERLSMVVPLQTRAERIFVEQVVTSEGIMIDQLEIWVFHTVALGPIEERTQDGQYEYNENILRTQIWSPSSNDWRETVKGITDRMARKVVPKYTLDEIMRSSDARTQSNGSTGDRSIPSKPLGSDQKQTETPRSAWQERLRFWRKPPEGDAKQKQPSRPSSDVNSNPHVGPSSTGPIENDTDAAPETRRDALVEELKSAVSDISVRIGVAIRGLDLGAVRVSPQVRARLEEGHLAHLALQAAEHNAAAIRRMEAARADAQRIMIQAIRQGWNGDSPNTDDTKDLVIAVRYIEALEKMATDPSAKVILPMDSRLLSSLAGSIGT